MKFSTLKPIVLGAVMLLGIFAQGHKAQAGKLETAILAGGCFWCVESDFESVRGVKSVVSGYTGGTLKNPTYKDVTKGGTGHYEAVKITYNPMQVTYDEILHKFLRSVDPTDGGGQFCDRGNSYRTAIFIADGQQKASAKAAIAAASAELGRKIVTPIKTVSAFYEAEDYHQDYYKGKQIVLTRNGPKSKASAYKFYRNACGRDARVQALWGSGAPFVGN